jgi:hypothetical protein
MQDVVGIAFYRFAAELRPPGHFSPGHSNRVTKAGTYGRAHLDLGGPFETDKGKVGMIVLNCRHPFGNQIFRFVSIHGIPPQTAVPLACNSLSFQDLPGNYCLSPGKGPTLPLKEKIGTGEVPPNRAKFSLFEFT